MKLLITDEEFEKTKSREKVPLECQVCGKIFYITKHLVQLAIWKRNKFKEGDAKRGHATAGDYCSKKCQGSIHKTAQLVICKNCGKEIEKKQGDLRKPALNRFCSRSCRTTFYNKNKTYGINRSKLEIYLEEQIEKYYPELNCKYNESEAIGSELDFYFPTLYLAIELNGIFHYEPIFGNNKLEKIQQNDQQKMLICAKKEIELCVIDSSKCNYLSISRKEEFWKIVDDLIKLVYERHNNSSEK